MSGPFYYGVEKSTLLDWKYIYIYLYICLYENYLDWIWTTQFSPQRDEFRYNGTKYTAHSMHIPWDNSISTLFLKNFLPTNWAQSNSWILPSIKNWSGSGLTWADHFTMAWKNQPWWTEYIYLYLDIHIYLQELLQTNKDSSIVMRKRERRNEIIDTLT